MAGKEDQSSDIAGVSVSANAANSSESGGAISESTSKKKKRKKKKKKAGKTNRATEEDKLDGQTTSVVDKVEDGVEEVEGIKVAKTAEEDDDAQLNLAANAISDQVDGESAAVMCARVFAKEEEVVVVGAHAAPVKESVAMIERMTEEVEGSTEKPKGLLLGRFDVSGCGGQPMRCTDKEILIRAVDFANGRPVVLQLLSNLDRLQAELNARTSTDKNDPENYKTSHIVEVLDVLCDSSETIGPPSYKDIGAGLGVVAFDAQKSTGPVLKSPIKVNYEVIQSPLKVHYWDYLAEEIRTHLRTHGDSSQYDATGDEYDSDELVTDDIANYPCLLVLGDYEQTLESHTHRFPRPNLRLARGVAADVVVGLMLLHTEGKVHHDLSPRYIVRCSSDVDFDYTEEDDRITGMWKIAGLGSCGLVGEAVENPGVLSSDWGYLPPEAATAIIEGDEDFKSDTAWDLWSLGCVLYRLVFGSDLWTTSRGGHISDEDVKKLSNWTKIDTWKRAAIIFPPVNRTSGERAAIDLIAKLLAPTPEERMKNFEFGIISVHQHEFVEGIALVPAALEAFHATQELVAIEEADHARYRAFTEKLSLEESWELNRARSILMLGAFEPVEVHVPTSFVVVKKPLSGHEGDKGRGEAALAEGIRWASAFSDVGPHVFKAILNNDISSVGRFWARIQGLFRGNYLYMYLVDDMTGEPVVLPPDQNTIGHGVPYPIPIKTRSDVLLKLLPLMHLTMRSIALYHGVTGIARLFGGGSEPTLSSDVRQGAQGVVDDLKDEQGDAVNFPFGSFSDDVSRVRENRERFLKDDTNIRCMALNELVKFYERKGVVVPGKPRGEDDFVGLKRLADNEGLALWTLLADADEFHAAIKQRAEERLKENEGLWNNSFLSRIGELEDALVKSESELETVAVAMSELEAQAAAPEKSAEVDEETTKHIRSLEKALTTSKENQERLAKNESERVAELVLTLKQTMAELEETEQKLKSLAGKSSLDEKVQQAKPMGDDKSTAEESTDSSIPGYSYGSSAVSASFSTKKKMSVFNKTKKFVPPPV